ASPVSATPAQQVDRGVAARPSRRCRESPLPGFSQWARLDSNQGPTDYELATGPRAAETRRDLSLLGPLFRYVASTGSRRSRPLPSPPACHARRLQREDARRIEGLYDLHASRDAESADERR